MSFNVCNYTGCTMKKTDKTRRFFGFPYKNKNRCKQWILASGNKNKKLLEMFKNGSEKLKKMSICEEHFSEESFVNSTHHRLNLFAKPIYFDTVVHLPSSSGDDMLFSQETENPAPSTECMDIEIKKEDPLSIDHSIKSEEVVLPDFHLATQVVKAEPLNFDSDDAPEEVVPVAPFRVLAQAEAVPEAKVYRALRKPEPPAVAEVSVSQLYLPEDLCTQFGTTVAGYIRQLPRAVAMECQTEILKLLVEKCNTHCHI